MEDYGEHASMASVCQISIETPIPPQHFNCLPYILFFCQELFFSSMLYVAAVDLRHLGFVWKTENMGRQAAVAVKGNGRCDY